MALKLPALHQQGEVWRERFRRERDILASLEHPNIARLYDAGVTESGQPWLAMEFVAGLTLSDHLSSRSLSLPRRLALFRQVLAAVAHAHRHLAGVAPGDLARAEDNHTGGAHPGDATEEHALPAGARLQALGAFLHRESPGHFAHGNQEWERAVFQLNGLVANRRDLLLEQGAGESFIRREMEVGTCHILFFLLFSSSVFAQQYYVRGEVKDESGNVLQNVIIQQYKTGYIFRTGSAGTFGIVAIHQTDTISFSMDGYQKQCVLVNADNYVYVKLKLLPASMSNARRDKLSSQIKDLGKEEQKTWMTGDETYASLLENHFVNAKKFPTTGMSLNVDRASYSNIRRFITQKSIVPPDAVRIEEMLN